MKFLLAAVSMTALTAAASAQDVVVPDYYPAEYQDMIKASRAESGSLVIYSNLAEFNWVPAIKGFEAQYPWINVETLDLSSSEVHTRWAAEAGSNARTGDILVSSAHDRWAQHIADADLEPYASPELAYLPEFAREEPGIFVLAADPMVIAYNTVRLPEGSRPTGFASFVELYKANPSQFAGAIGTLDPARAALGLSIWYNLIDTWKDETVWDDLSIIGGDIRGETSGGAINEKLATGEYATALYVTGSTLFTLIEQPGGELLGYVFPDDGTPISLRGMGIPPNGANPNSSRLFVDYMLSQAGQTELAVGGLTVYRDDVSEDDVPYFTYQSIAELVGEDNMIIAGFNPGLLTEAEAFIATWQKNVQPN